MPPFPPLGLPEWVSSNAFLAWIKSTELCQILKQLFSSGPPFLQCLSDYDMLQDGDLGDITDEFISNEVSALDEEDVQQQQGDKNRSKKKKRPLSLVDESPVKKKTKIHPAVEILGNLSSAVTEAAAKKAEAKTKELAERKEIATAEAKLKEREINILERKVELEV